MQFTRSTMLCGKQKTHVVTKMVPIKEENVWADVRHVIQVGPIPVNRPRYHSTCLKASLIEPVDWAIQVQARFPISPSLSGYMPKNSSFRSSNL